MNHSRFTRVKRLAVLAALVTAPLAQATWSIVIADSATKEVAVGTVTCLNNYDLLAIVPVVVVGKGAGACQAAGDFDGIRRPVIFNNLVAGTSPQSILTLLAQITGHQSRQYGIADTQGRMITFTGSQDSQWAGGVVGTQGTMVYAIQGNILAGACVVPAIEQAILNTSGDVPAKLMAGMQAAHEKGGDGRCSCSPSNPTGCGCPPATFTKCGHIGGMVVARIGDTDDPACNLQGCADGSYFMRLNVPNQAPSRPDPVIQLQGLYDAWRAGLVGRPDAIHSVVTFDPHTIPPNGAAATTMHITLLDWQDLPMTAALASLTVVHAANSSGISSIGQVVDQGGGTYSVTLTAGATVGIDRFVVTANDGTRPVILMPAPSLRYFAFGDLDCDGAVNAFDIDPFVLALTDPLAYAQGYASCNYLLADVNHDGFATVNDIDGFVQCLVNGCP
jgi:hypothetical protein